MKYKIKSWINAILLIVTLIVNFMGAMGFINGLSQKDISDRYQTLVTPAPSTFSIWSVIYAFLIISVIVMIIKNKDSYYRLAIEKISSLFWLSCALNIGWIISFSYNLIGLSTILILIFLIVMILIIERITKIHTKNYLLLPITFGLYSGWLFIATIVNISVWLVKIEWGRLGLSAEIWSSIILIVSVVLTFIVVIKTKNVVFPLPISWAYFGIYKFLIAPEGFQGNYSLLQNTALIGIFILLGLSAFQFYKNKYKVLPIL